MRRTARLGRGGVPLAMAALLSAVMILAPPSVSAAEFTRVEGNVETRSGAGGAWSRARRGDILEADDWIRTGPDGRADIVIEGRHDLEIERSSLVRYDGDRFDVIHMTAMRGGVRSRVDTLSEGSFFSISAPSASAGVRGTDFTVAVGEAGGVRVDVEEGTVMVGDGAISSGVGAGEAVEIDPFAGLVPVSEGAARDLEAWRRVEETLAATSAETVTEAFRPVVFRELARIRVSFDTILALYERHGELISRRPENPDDLAFFYREVIDDLRPRTREAYRMAIEGRGRLDAAAGVIETMRERYGVPAPWIDEAVSGYANIWDGWIEMIGGFWNMLDGYETLAAGAEGSAGGK